MALLVSLIPAVMSRLCPISATEKPPGAILTWVRVLGCDKGSLILQAGIVLFRFSQKPNRTVLAAKLRERERERERE